MPSIKRPIGASALVAFALVVAACGSGGDAVQTTESGAASESSSAAETPSADSADTADAADTADGSADDGSEEAAPEPAAEPESEPEAEAAGPQVDDHVFPDLETVNIVDGATVNLADQLAGGDTPILLWFFAPH